MPPNPKLFDSQVRVGRLLLHLSLIRPSQAAANGECLSQWRKKCLFLFIYAWRGFQISRVIPVVLWYIYQDIFSSETPQNPPFNMFWRCLGIGVLALGSSRLQELWSFPCSTVFYGSIDFILLHPLTSCAYVVRTGATRSTCASGSWTVLKYQIAGIALLPIMGCSSICNQLRHTVSSAEPQNSGVWLMLQPHPLDHRHNYIVINFAGSLDFLVCVPLWLLFIKYHLPEERECNRAAICGVRDVLRVE